MGNIPMLQGGNGGVKQLALWSDAAVERAYSRVSGALGKLGEARSRMFESAGDALNKGFDAAARNVKRIQDEEDLRAQKTYEVLASERQTDLQEKILRGDFDLSTQEKLDAWVVQQRADFDKWHDETAMNDSAISPAAKRVGANLRSAGRVTFEHFLRTNYSTKFKENRVREKNDSLERLKNASAENVRVYYDFALASGATPDEAASAAKISALTNMQKFTDSRIAYLKTLEREEAVKQYPVVLNELLSKINELSNYDGKKNDGSEGFELSSEEALFRDKMLPYYKKHFDAECAQFSPEFQTAARVQGFMTAYSNRLSDKCAESKQLGLAQLGEALAERIRWARTTKDGKAFVETCFGGDYSAFEDALVKVHKDKEKSLKEIYDVQKSEILRLVSEGATKILCESLQATLAGAAIPDECKESYSKVFGGNPPVPFIIPDGVGVASGMPFEANEYRAMNEKDVGFGVLSEKASAKVHVRETVKRCRVSARELWDMLNLCTTASDGKHVAEAAMVHDFLRNPELAFTKEDVKLLTLALEGASKGGNAVTQMISRIESIRAQCEGTVGAQRSIINGKSYKISAEENKHCRDAMLKGLDKMITVLQKCNFDFANADSSLGAEIEENVSKIEEMIREGANFDQKLAVLKRLGANIGVFGFDSGFYDKKSLADTTSEVAPAGVKPSRFGTSKGIGGYEFSARLGENAVIDGDTVRVTDANGKRFDVRIRGINTAEKINYVDLIERSLGVRSFDYLSGNLSGATDVRVVFDGRDKYGRLLGDILYRAPNSEWRLVSGLYDQKPREFAKPKDDSVRGRK